MGHQPVAAPDGEFHNANVVAT
jgi:hypothetical protein